MTREALDLTIEDIVRMRYFLNVRYQKFTRDQKAISYRSWAHGGEGWRILRSGGTNICQALTWYQHEHKPGSKEWRPSVIVRAVYEASKGTVIPEPWRRQAGL